MKVAIAGASGRMGRMLIEAALGAPDIKIAAAFDRAASPAAGRDCAEFLGRSTGVSVLTDLSALKDADVLIDFTRPEATLEHLAACIDAGVNMVIGTTGFDDAGKRAIEKAAEKIAIVSAPNMGVGVNAMLKLLDLAARVLDDGFDVEIVEMHHKHKVDAPSGTALKMGEVIARARHQTLDEAAVYAREGNVGERKPGTIGFASVRGGDVIGDHTVVFAGVGERIEITHRASSRMTYAVGSMRAARFLTGRRAGLYDMFNVLGLDAESAQDRSRG
ncbi:MAG: 4-hydroxy-tetrahydrodipicolinate reductase [Burkholderiaceae bacterium]|nr:4-hydroxy-tetrahydrodipicolinate reductase [Burkholderiaceae bacterium]